MVYLLNLKIIIYIFFFNFPVQLSEAVKRGACSLGANQPDSQVMVISAVKDVASALGELINATKMASGKSIHDPSMNDLKESAKVCLQLKNYFLTQMLSFKYIF